MHRHGYQGRKLSRKAGPRQALIKGQLTSLVLHEQITTTEAKARELVPVFERLITRAKQNNLAAQRDARAQLLTENAARKLFTVLLPAFAGRSSGYVRLIKAGYRRGDRAPLAVLGLVKSGGAPDTKEPAADIELKPAAKSPAKPRNVKTEAKA
jgi:large subunit ribosomal protein L17